MKKIYLISSGFFFLLLSSSLCTFAQQDAYPVAVSGSSVKVPPAKGSVNNANKSNQGNTQPRTSSCEIDSLSYIIKNVTNCSGTPCDGSVTITGVNGLGLSGNYTYTWSDGHTGPADTALCTSNGTLFVTVADANGCSFIQGFNVLTGDATGNDTLHFTMWISFTHSNGTDYWICDGQCIQIWLGNSKNSNDIGIPDLSTGGGPYTYVWSGVPGENDGPGKFTDCPAYGFPPTYSVTITDAACVSITITYTPTIEPNPIVTTTSTVNPTCPNTCNGRVTANPGGGSSPYTYSWNNGATTQADTQLCSGFYKVIVSDSWQCSATTSGNLVTPPPIAAQISSTNSTCTGGLGSATINSVTGGTPGPGYTYSWNTMPPQTSAMAANLKEGDYIVTITDGIGCTQQDTVAITGGGPYTIAPINNATICDGQFDTLTASPLGGDAKYLYSWNPGGMTDSSITVNPATTTLYTVTVTDSNGCIATQTATVTVNPLPVVTVSPPDTSVCTGDNVQLTATGGATYAWSPSAGLSDSAIANPVAMLDANTTYVVMVTTASGCSAGDSVTLSVVEPPNPGIGPGGDICIGQSMQLNATGGATYSWLPAAGLSDPTISDPVATPDGTTTYTVTVSTGAACPPATDSATVIVHLVPIIKAGPDTTVFPGTTVTLYVNGGGPEYTWSTGGSVSCNSCANPVTTPLETTTYIVSITDSFGCRAADTVVIDVDDNLTLFVANAFTPIKPDGTNDVFYAYGVGIYEFEFYIYDRWGEKIFESKDPNYGWDGTYNGRTVQEDVYVWVAKAQSFTGKSISKVGSVTVLK